ncbi:beta-ribofuranosylaminobenzene 5'-phosphate synthase family protein [Halobellus rubicundus]|uniref:Beta-ribofuranosylaminobenzene 5'-phosphate synthase n=1 Tax=Halobellus rubicundus TaxID=2996466 RepID=A0ABD5MCV6_9EURY
MSRVRVATGARLHFGFGNLSLDHERLYGGLGVGLDAPRTVVTAEPADDVACAHDLGREYAERAVELLGVSGASVAVESTLPRHVGLGSGTQLALATLAAVARAHGCDPRARSRAPELGRAGRSGVGVAAFKRGGVVVDGGHPSEAFTPERPADGTWETPPVAIRRDVPEGWRFLLVVPEADVGRNGECEDESMRCVITDADPGVADRIAGVVLRRLLPALADGSAARFGAAVERIDRLNGRWYADEQSGIYREPVGTLVDFLSSEPSCFGVGQSSWGPCVYGVTDVDHADAARRAGEEALRSAGLDGEVRVVAGRNEGAEIVRT